MFLDQNILTERTVMVALLHIDTSVRHEGSVSRELSAAYAEHWRRANPDGAYTYRDLAEKPVPHLNALTLATKMVSPADFTPEQAADAAVSQELVDELLAADVVLLGVPMYNFSIPSTLKAWLDRVIGPATAISKETGEGALVGTRVVVAASKGGSYAAGAPRADFDHLEPYLGKVLSQVGLDRNLRFITAEFTLAHLDPALAQFREHADASRSAALESARELARIS